MNAVAAFEERKDTLAAQLETAKDMRQAVSAAQMTLEQIACDLAQDEADDRARQRQQAVFSALKRAPQLLGAARAQGELVVQETEKSAFAGVGKIRLTAMGVGAVLLVLTCGALLLDGKAMLCAANAVGGLVLYLGAFAAPAQIPARARGVLAFDAQEMLHQVRELCRAADVCVSDLAMLADGQDAAHISGTADEAMLDLLCSMLEARASGKSEVASACLSQAETCLHRLGLSAVCYDAAHTALFDMLPTVGQTRTVRPALVKDGQLVRRGVAAVQTERSVGA